MSKAPILDLNECTNCLACVELLPEVFKENQAGYIEVIEAEAYPTDEVDEAIAICPADCISWVEGS